MNPNKVVKSCLIYFLALSFFLLLPTKITQAEETEELGFWFEQEAISLQQKVLTLFYDQKEEKIRVGDFIKSEPFLVPQENYYSEIENFHFCFDKINGINICDLTTSLTEKNHNIKKTKLSLRKDSLSAQIEKYKEKIKQQPKEGRVEMAEDSSLRVIEQSRPGIELDVEGTLNKILDDIEDDTTRIEFAVKRTEPIISTENLSELGIKELIGHGESNFRGSPKNRIHNINVALEKFHGYLIKPGEEFSFTTILGPVEKETGYKEELVIKQNKTIPEYGGGVCQVSTTMFRVALNTGLKITERHNHAYPVSYYSPQGTDATIYVPKPDLRFLNDTPGYILIQGKIEGTILSFDMYGTSDGRKIELEGPTVTERTSDGKLKTVLYQVINDAEGVLIRKDTFKSFYDNPNKYHEPQYTTKPDDWSTKQWDEYKATHGL